MEGAESRQAQYISSIGESVSARELSNEASALVFCASQMRENWFERRTRGSALGDRVIESELSEAVGSEY